MYACPNIDDYESEEEYIEAMVFYWDELDMLYDRYKEECMYCEKLKQDGDEDEVHE
jgi:hypothetical protein